MRTNFEFRAFNRLITNNHKINTSITFFRINTLKCKLSPINKNNNRSIIIKNISVLLIGLHGKNQILNIFISKIYVGYF